MEAVDKGDYTGWETKVSVIFGAPDPVVGLGEASREFWALLMLKTEVEAKTKVRLARKGDGIGGFIRMDGWFTDKSALALREKYNMLANPD